jgi:alpha-glucosidase (family GH31 glycosyl hydrolase)
MRYALFFAAAAAWAQSANVIPLSETARLELISPLAFRVQRGRLPSAARTVTVDQVERTLTQSDVQIRIETAELVITFQRKSGTLAVAAPAGLNLYQETAATAGGLQLEVRTSERFYGLGPRPEAAMDARGLSFTPRNPFFISSRGYGWWLGSGGASFDLAKTAPGVLRVAPAKAEVLEYYFAFGPSVKEIWEQRHKVVPAIVTPTVMDLGLISMPRLPAAAVALPKFSLTGADLLCADTAAMMHASLSGVLLPAFDIARYHDADDAVFRRALRLGVFSPVFYDSAPDAQSPRAAEIEKARSLRKRLSHFLLTYADEARYRGYPVFHPLLMQFPRDPMAGGRIDAFMFGDEFLLAPVCYGAAKREMYLPMGIWTDWNTNQTHQGRRTVTLDVPGDGLLILVKNGSIVPLSGVNAGDPTELHYFPKNGGEFFFYEPDAADYSQAHAGPAAGVYRMEMESKVARKYEWVIHHMDRPSAVGEPNQPPYGESAAAGPLAPRTWRYDAGRRELHVGIDAPAHSDIIVNASF